jgi:hypothetical protein
VGRGTRGAGAVKREVMLPLFRGFWAANIPSPHPEYMGFVRAMFASPTTSNVFV